MAMRATSGPSRRSTLQATEEIVAFALKVATLNLRHNQDRWPERRPLVVGELAQERPHLVGLQEVWLPGSQGAVVTDLLNEACAAAGYRERYTLRQQPKVGLQGLWEGIAILSRLPIEDYGWLDLGGGERVAQRLRVALPAGSYVDFYNAHLHHRRAEQLRLRQARRLLAWMAEQTADGYPILVGDMNAVPGSPPIEALQGALRSAYEAVHGREPDYTDPTPLVRKEGIQRKVIDYILVSPATDTGRVVRAWRAFERPAPSLHRSRAGSHARGRVTAAASPA